MERSLPTFTTTPLSGILMIRGIKLWMLNRMPNWTTVIPLLVRNKLKMGCIKVKFSTKVVADNIKA